MSSNSPPLHLYLESAINFLYYFCVSPFRFKFKQKTGKYILVSSTCSKFLPLAIHTVGIAVTILGLYTSTSSQSFKNPRCIFHIAVFYSRFLTYYSLLFAFWTRRHHFEQFFTLSTPPTFSSSASIQKTKWFVYFLCFMMIPAAITIEILNYTGVSGFAQYIWSTFMRAQGPRKMERMLGFEGQQAKMITSSETSSESPQYLQSQLAPNSTLPQFPPYYSISHFNFVITIIFDIVRIYIRVCNNMAVLFCIFAGITLNQATSRFLESVAKDRNQDKVILKYNNFYKFGSSLNKMCGCIVLGTVLSSPPFFIVYIIGTFTDLDFNGPRVMFYSGMYCCLYIIAAEASSRIGEFKEWIIDHGEDENESQLFAIFVDVSENPMGLQGMGCFTLTYGFTAKMFAMIMSFTIILLQFETTPTSPMTSIPCE